MTKGNIITTKMMQNHGNMQELFEYLDESDGTQRLFDLIPLFYEHNGNRLFLLMKLTEAFIRILPGNF